VKILLVEDHTTLREMIAEHLSRVGFVVDTAATGGDALSALRLVNYDGMILDLGLPTIDGMTVLTSVRAAQNNTVPIIILTARDELENRLRGLNSGADDYLVKPFDMLELEARLRAVRRRPGARRSSILEQGNVQLDSSTHHASVLGQTVDLARREFALLEDLLRAAPRIVIKDQLEDRLYSFDQDVTPNAIEAVVSRLRKKLIAAGANINIQTVRGIGYRILAGGEDENALD
jgi:two-component system, OmpR family, response regulator QseB